MARDGGSLAFPGFRELSQCQAWYWDDKRWGFSGLPRVQKALTVLGLVLGWQGMGVLWASRGSESSHSVRPGAGMARDGGSLAFPGVQRALTVLGLVLG